MIGVNPPGHFLWDARTTGEQIGRYAALCAQDAELQQPDADLAASMRKRRRATCPDHWWFLPIRQGNVQVGVVLRADGRDHGRRRPARRRR